MRRALGIFRDPAFSPGAHENNDRAILRAVLSRLASAGYRIAELDERQIVQGAAVPAADLYLNMCQGRPALERLATLESEGARVVNPATSCLKCHRVAQVRALAQLPLPETCIVGQTDGFAALERWLAQHDSHEGVWVKRGDVHAEGPNDVVRCAPQDARAALDTLFRRGITHGIVQAHVPGRVVKFYGVGRGQWFRSFAAGGDPNDVDASALAGLGGHAAALLGLQVWGGDAIVGPSGELVLIDINDWPSFARFREDAADAIARHVQLLADPRPSHFVEEDAACLRATSSR